MGQPDAQSGTGEGSVAAERALQSVTQDLQALQKGLIAQLSQEVTRLQTEKSRLISDIEKLQTYHRALQSRQMEALSQQQVAQQQLWAKQLAQILASHLQAQIAQRLNQIAATQSQSAIAPTSPNTLAAIGANESANRLLASLDATFNDTFKTLQRELDSYQSSLSQQISRMHSLEQQGEAILAALIDRLREQLQTESTRMPPEGTLGASPSAFTVPPARYPVPAIAEAPAPPPTLPNPPSVPPVPPRSDAASRYSSPTESFYTPPSGNGRPTALHHPTAPHHRETHPARHPESPPASATLSSLTIPAAPLPLPAKSKKEFSNFQLGLLLVLISTAALSFHNVVVRVIGRESVILGWLFQDALKTGGFIDLTSLGNSLLLLWWRMLVVLPMMIPVAMFLYPSVWRDIRRFLTASDRRPAFNVIGSGCFLFLSQILIYVAIAQIGPGPAVTIMFMYPIVTVPLAWFLFGDRPTTLRWVVMGVIMLGVALTRLGPVNSMPGGGVLIAMTAGVGFALYLILMQLGFKKLHPIPVSLIQFFTIFVITSLILIGLLPVPIQVQVNNPLGFVVGGIVLGALTLVGYLTNNFGVRFMGAARASIVASSGPAVTALLGLVVINDSLGIWQWLGILLVTGGVCALSFERMKTTAQPAKPASTNGQK